MPCRKRTDFQELNCLLGFSFVIFEDMSCISGIRHSFCHMKTNVQVVHHQEAIQTCMAKLNWSSKGTVGSKRKTIHNSRAMWWNLRGRRKCEDSQKQKFMAAIVEKMGLTCRNNCITTSKNSLGSLKLMKWLFTSRMMCTVKMVDFSRLWRIIKQCLS